MVDVERRRSASTETDLDAMAEDCGAMIFRSIRRALTNAYAWGRDDERREMQERLKEVIWADSHPTKDRSDGSALVPSESVEDVVPRVNAVRPSARRIIMGMLDQAGGPVSIADVRQGVILAGWTEAAFNKMRSKLKKAQLIRNDAGSYVLTDSGRQSLREQGTQSGSVRNAVDREGLRNAGQAATLEGEGAHMDMT